MEHAPELTRPSTRAKGTALWGGVTFVLGAVGLAGWITGLRLLGSLQRDYIPMAPDTAVLFMVLGLALVAGACRAVRRIAGPFAIAFAGLVSAYIGLKFVESFSGRALTLEGRLFSVTDRLGAIPLGRMSPYAGLLFLMCGVALLIRLLGKDRPFPQNASGGLGAVILVAGAVATVGYLFGTPLLYGGATVPLAATTAAGFLSAGFGLILMAGPESFIMRRLSGPSVRARLLRGILPVIVLAILFQGLLGTRLAEAFAINKALLSAILTLAFIAVSAAIVTRSTGSILQRVARAEAERLNAERALRESEERYRSLFENNHAVMLIIDPDDGSIVDANPAAAAYYGWTRDELRRMKIGEINTLPAPDVKAEMDRARRGERRQFFFRHRRADGSAPDVEVYSGPIVLGERHLLYSIVHDITERKRAEEDLRQAVKQKGILMKELEHRVKNSLAVVSGLLGLEMERLADEASRKIFAETRARIRSVASLYEQLYGGDDPASVNLARYFRQISESLIGAYASGNIVLRTDLAECLLDTKRAIPLGLILNELATNSLKYAYAAEAGGEVRVVLKTSEAGLTLSVEDDGRGLPEGFDPASSGGMGMNLVRMLAREIDADLSFERGRGTKIAVSLKP